MSPNGEPCGGTIVGSPSTRRCAMSETLDVYRDWLKITATDRPLNHYQLLRLRQFEDDVAKIRDHYGKLAAHVRKLLDGPHAEQAQSLLNELARAMLCLTDVQRKQQYDASLGRAEAAVAGRRSFEQILLANQVVNAEQLDKARQFAETVGLELRDAIIQQKLAPADRVMLAYAESQGIPYVELDEVGVDEYYAPQIPPQLARQHSCVPVMVDGEQLLLASPNPLVPDVEEEIRLRLGMPVRCVLCTPASVNAAIAKYYPRDAVLATPAAKPAQAAKPKQTAAQNAPLPLPENQREATRRHAMFAVIGFNLAVIVAMLAQYMLISPAKFSFFVSAFVSLTLGAVVAGLTFVVARKQRW